MAAPGLSTPSDRQVGERDVLLATKLTIPRVRADLLPRSRLLDALEEQLARELVLVCTPAGFGKTTLLASWARAARWPVAWLSLDADDNDPVRFWRYVAAATDRLHPGVADPIVALLTGPSPPSLAAVVARLVNQLAALPKEFTLVLDDYHAIQTRAVHDSLGLLVDRLPASMRLVLASRADPPLPLARLRARGQLAELRAADLRFTPEETASFLRQVWGLELPSEAVGILEARTEGWAAGLQLAALSLQGRPDPGAAVAAFSGSHRYVLDYLSQEVLERQPASVRRFLLETSVLERLCGPLCDAVTGRLDGQQLLEELERANLFLVPLDDERRWWRYHQLFAELLRARLHQAAPDREPPLHRAAAAWCQQHGLLDDAVRHAVAAGDPGWAAGLVEQHVEELLLWRGEQATVARWLATLPGEVVGARPRLALAQAIFALMEGRLDAVEPLLDAAKATAADTGQPYQPSVGRSASILANVPAATAVLGSNLARFRGDAQGVRASAEQAMAHLTAADRVLGGWVRYQLAVADWLGGRVADAERGLAGVVAGGRAAGADLAVPAAHDLGAVQRARGRLGAALRTYRRALELVTRPGHPPLPWAGIAEVGLAQVLRQQGHLEDALRHASEGIALCRQLTFTLPLDAGLATLAWIRQAQGDPTGAREAIGEAERAVPSQEVVALLDPAPSERARLLLAQGEVAAAQRWVQERGLGEDDQPEYPREPEYLVLARVLLAQQVPDRAMGLLDRLGTAAKAQGRSGSLIEILALQALALQAAGEPQRALAALIEALSLARPEGYVRVFADEGPPMAALLRRLVAEGRRGALEVPVDYLGRILRGIQEPAAPVGPQAPAAVAGLVEPLTARELEVLRLLAEGMGNQEIAQQLVVTRETVKKHLSHIFDKLGAASRTQAVAHARRLGLLR